MDAQLAAVMAREAPSAPSSARRKQPRRADPERLRLRADVTARGAPVGRHLHRHARPDELLRGHRPAGSCPRGTDPDVRRGAPGLHQTVSDTRDTTERAPPAGGPAEARARSQPRRPRTRPRPRSRCSRPRRPPPAQTAGELRPHRPQQGERARNALRGRRRLPEAPCRADRRHRRPATAEGQHPVAVQRDVELADGRDRDPELRLHGLRLGAAAMAAAPTSTRASTSSRP